MAFIDENDAATLWEGRYLEEAQRYARLLLSATEAQLERFRERLTRAELERRLAAAEERLATAEAELERARGGEPVFELFAPMGRQG